jgi:hypothetical protein
VAPCASLRRVDVDAHLVIGGIHQDDEEVPAVAVEVVAGAAGGAEHRRFGGEVEPVRVVRRRQLGQVQLVTRDGVPHGQVATPTRMPGSVK